MQQASAPGNSLTKGKVTLSTQLRRLKGGVQAQALPHRTASLQMSCSTAAPLQVAEATASRQRQGRTAPQSSSRSGPGHLCTEEAGAAAAHMARQVSSKQVRMRTAQMTRRLRAHSGMSQTLCQPVLGGSTGSLPLWASWSATWSDRALSRLQSHMQRQQAGIRWMAAGRADQLSRTPQRGTEAGLSTSLCNRVATMWPMRRR